MSESEVLAMVIDEILDVIYDQVKGLSNELSTYQRSADVDMEDDTVSYLQGKIDALDWVTNQILDIARSKSI